MSLAYTKQVSYIKPTSFSYNFFEVSLVFALEKDGPQREPDAKGY
jgi:hypothetical protein